MIDVCKALRIKKQNTTAYHPQCNGLVERLYRTLKTMQRKHEHSLARSEISICMGWFLGISENPTRKQTVKSRHFCYSGWTYMHQWRHKTVGTIGWKRTSNTGRALQGATSRQLAEETARRAQNRYKTNFDKIAHQRDIVLVTGSWSSFRKWNEGNWEAVPPMARAVQSVNV